MTDRELRFDVLDLRKLSTELLIRLLDDARAKRDANPDPFAARAYQIRMVELQREIAIHNHRATVAQDSIILCIPGDLAKTVARALEAHALHLRSDQPNSPEWMAALRADAERLEALADQASADADDGEPRLPVPEIAPLPSVVECGSDGCHSRIDSAALPGSWALFDGVWLCSGCLAWMAARC